MPSAKKTPNYNLTQYADNGTDKVSFMGDYNSDMTKVDTALHDNATALHDNATAITTKADKATTYTKSDVDGKLDTKADKSTTYTKDDIDGKVTAINVNKADKADTYTKSDIDTKLGNKADTKTLDDNIATLSSTVAQKADLPNTTHEQEFIIAGHRCGNGWPEQSLMGAEWCWTHGYLPEIDVRRLSDGTLVLCHDDNPSRTMLPTVSTQISSMDTPTWRKMTLVPAINGGVMGRAPFFTDFLRASNGRASLIECKQLDTDTMDAIIAMIKRFGYTQSTFITCFDNNLSMLAARAGMQVMALMSAVPDMTTAQKLYDSGIRWVSIDQNGLNSAQDVSNLHAYGFKVMVWTVDSFDRAQILKGWGADGFTSDIPDYVTQTGDKTGDVLHDGVGEFFVSSNKSPGRTNVNVNITLSGSSLVTYPPALDNDIVSIIPTKYSNLVLDEGRGKAVRMIVSGVSEAITGTIGDSFVRCGLFTGSPDRGFIDGTDSNGQEWVELVIRQDMRTAVWHKSGNGTRTNSDPEFKPRLVKKDWAIGERIPFNLQINFGQNSINVRGNVGISTIDEKLEYGSPFSDNSLVTPFYCLNGWSYQPRLDRWHVAQIGAFTPRMVS